MRMVSVVQCIPELIVVPSRDQRTYAEMCSNVALPTFALDTSSERAGDPQRA
jgi:hypothetical protein